MTLMKNDRTGRAMIEYGHNIGLWCWFTILQVQRSGEWRCNPEFGVSVMERFSDAPKMVEVGEL